MSRRISQFAVVSVAVILCFASIGGCSSPLEDARRASCANNLKQMSLVLRMWAGEHEDLLPTTLSETYDEYLADVLVLNCPSSGSAPVDPSRIDEASDYEYVGAGLNEKEALPSTPVMLENPENHGGAGRHVLYMDGSVRWETP